MTTHTPGPWNAHVAANNRFRAATGVGAGDYGAVCTTGGHRPSEDENAANARLIALAPELAEALANLIDSAVAYDLIASSHPDEREREIETDFRAALARARALLARMEG